MRTRTYVKFSTRVSHACRTRVFVKLPLGGTVRNGIGNASRALAIYCTLARRGARALRVALLRLIVCGTLSTRTAALGMKRAFTDVHLHFK